jgi:YD repeat-containing protein
VVHLRADGEADRPERTKILSSYGPARGLLSSITDPKGQIKSFAYAKDDRLLGVSYSNAAVATPPVSWQWDASYPRIASMQDGIGQTLYSYVPAGQQGAGRIAYVDGPLASDTNGNLLTRLKRSLGVPGQTLSYTYDSANQLLSVSNPKDTSNYPQSYTYDPAGNLTAATTPPGSRSFTYNSLNQRITDAGVAQQFDGTGNLSTGMGFSFAWDAEDRVKSISYNGTVPCRI